MQLWWVWKHRWPETHWNQIWFCWRIWWQHCLMMRGGWGVHIVTMEPLMKVHIYEWGVANDKMFKIWVRGKVKRIPLLCIYMALQMIKCSTYEWEGKLKGCVPLLKSQIWDHTPALLKWVQLIIEISVWAAPYLPFLVSDCHFRI